MRTAAPHPLVRLRATLARRDARAALFGLALALFGVQLFLQTHSIAHQLGPQASDACDTCLVAKSSTPLVATAPALPAPTVDVDYTEAGASATLERAPLAVRNRGPPSTT